MQMVLLESQLKKLGEDEIDLKNNIKKFKIDEEHHKNKAYEKLIVKAAMDKEKRQKGWMTRIHPITLSTGRVLLPLYSDGYNISLLGISDDNGHTWKSSKPIVGFGPVQPALLEKKDGTIVAYI